MQTLEQVQGENMRMKQERYIKLITEKSKHLAKAMKFYEAGNGWIKSNKDMVRCMWEDVWKVERFPSWKISYRNSWCLSQ